jgi:YesN/AraC family two-component response regulator
MEKITLVEAAKTVHFSSQYLSKIFKEETGYTFKQYLNMIRIENSKKLLKEGDLSLMDICYLVGFSDQSHFSRTFKKISGMSPKKYLEQQDIE